MNVRDADGHVIGSAGNISVRVDEHRFVVTAAGVPYDELTAADHVSRRGDGETVQDARTGDLIVGVPRLVAERSAVRRATTAAGMRRTATAR